MTDKNAPISDNALKIAEIAATLFPSYTKGIDVSDENSINNEFFDFCHIVNDTLIKFDNSLNKSSISKS